MKNFVIVILVAFGMLSCASSGKTTRNKYIIGKYYAKVKGHFKTSIKYDLDIQPDSFFIIIEGHDYCSQESGIWIIRDDSLFLLCKDENRINYILSSGYMSRRKIAVKIINSNRLRVDNIILKRRRKN